MWHQSRSNKTHFGTTINSTLVLLIEKNVKCLFLEREKAVPQIRNDLKLVHDEYTFKILSGKASNYY